MPNEPISVIIPTFNRAHLIGRAIRSVMAATLPIDEIIVVDDGSTDGTGEVVKGFGARVRYIPRPHAGAGATRNAGVEAARHELLAFLDSDDQWMPDKLYLQRAVMAHMPEITFCFSDFACSSPGTPDRPHSAVTWHKDTRPWEEIFGPGTLFSEMAALPEGREDFKVYVGNLYRLEMTENYISAFTLVVHRRKAGESLFFAEDLPTFEDWDCFGRLTRDAQCAYLACDTAVQCGHPGPRLTNAKALVTTECRLKILDRVWGQDAAFLSEARNRQALERLKEDQHLIRAKYLLRDGRMDEARSELTQVHGSPLAYRALAKLPGLMCKGMLAAYAWVSFLTDIGS